MYSSFPVSSKAGQDGDKPFACSRCRRCFKRVEHLRRHIRTHTKEKPYACHCGISFTRKDLLKRHVDISHNQREAPVDLQASTNSYPTSLPATQLGDMQSSSCTSAILQQSENQCPTLYRESTITDNGFNSSIPASMPYSDQLPLMPHNLAESRVAYTFSDEELSHLQEITGYMDDLNSTAGVNFSPFELGDLSMMTENTPEGSRGTGDKTELDGQNVNPWPGSPFWSWLPTAPSPGRSLAAVGEHHSQLRTGLSRPIYQVSEERRLHIEKLLSTVCDVISEFPTFSRHTWTRYLTSFWEGFQPHMPFIHMPTMQFEDLSIEEILAFAAIGAQYRFEHHNADRLFYAGKAVVLERMKRVKGSSTYYSTSQLATRKPITRSSQGASRLLACTTEESQHESGETESNRRRALFHILRSAVALLGYAAWETAELVKQSLEMQSVVSELLRLIGMKEDSIVSSSASWVDWACSESYRRIQLIAFCWMHTLSIAYNHPPVMMCSEIGLRLPCAPAEWSAKTEVEWQAARACSKLQPEYQESLSLLMTSWPNSIHPHQESTPLGNYILLHGLIHRIYLIHELAKLDEHDISGRTRMRFEELENALRNWTSLWQESPDSNLDPKDERGPIPFTSSALLGLAYVRLHLNLGPHRRLETRDPKLIAKALFELHPLKRDYRLVPSLLYAVHALSIPVRHGIDYVARSQALFWSVRHALSGFECAVFLIKWLLLMHQTQSAQPLTGNELHLLHWIRCIVDEGRVSLDPGENDEERPLDQLSPLHLGLETTRLWSRMFRLNVQWPVINILGLGLEEYADILEREYS